jgi:hypothetical protein
MKDNQKLATKTAYTGEKKASMKRRDDYNNYRGRRMYMITIEVEGRKPVFGTVEGDANAPANSSDAPHITLSPLGQAVCKEWMGIPRYYPQIEMIALQMMPDHLHGILFVHDTLPVHLGQVINGFKTGCNRIVRTMNSIATAQPSPTHKPALASKPASATSPSATSPSVQAAVSSQPSTFTKLFAPNYNDLLLKTYDELQHWKNYLADNPRRLLLRRASPTLLRPFFGLHIGSYTYNGIGNRQLLTAPHRVSVRISRKMTGQQLDAEVARYTALAHSGTVLISPAISPGERRVMRTAFNAGLPTIVIMKNGFTPFSKPAGEQFYACAKGRLLMLSAFEYQNEKRQLTAQLCQQMNLMAWELAGNTPLTEKG